MYIITFYSFKGGVGRTMALVNTGAELARRGRKVLLVDFDLEAPGLSTYDLLRPAKPHPGIVEFVTEFRDTRRAPSVTDFIYPAKPVDKNGGRLWVMPAGRGDTAYRRMLNNLNWRTLYKDDDGFLLFEDTRLQWEAEFHPDYVLIDAHTGHTDIEGICTRQLADVVVVVFYPNEQNLVGLTEVCRHIRAEETSGLKKKIKLHFVASNVPDLDDEELILRRQLRQFESELTIPSWKLSVIHRNETLHMMNQPVFVQQRPRSRLAREYRQLIRALVMENPIDRDGALFYLRRLERDLKLRGEPWVNKYVRPDRRLDEIETRFSNDPTVLRRLALWYRGLGELDQALRQFDHVLQLRPGWPEVLYERGRCRRQVGDKTGAVEDFMQFLQTSPRPDLISEATTEPDDSGTNDLQERVLSALRELIDASFEAYLKALAFPQIRENRCIASYDGICIWLHSATEQLLRERRWEDAIRYLETDVPELLGRVTPTVRSAFGENMLSRLEGERLWYLAMASWGKTGSLPSDLCQKALNEFSRQADENLQRSSLLHWGIGDSDEANNLLESAMCMEEPGMIHAVYGRISSWTFRETSEFEFKKHFLEQERMFRGKPTRPAFLDPPL